MFKVDYILNAYISGQDLQIPSKNGHNFIEDEDDIEGAMALPVNDSSADAQIQEVLNIFPHLTNEFVQKLLQRYESTEKAIAEYLEGNLPPDLIEEELSSSRGPTTSNQSSLPPVPSTSDAINNNKFLDQFNFADNAKVIVKMGKGFPGDHKNASSLLNDKSHIQSLKNRYEAYGLVAENDYDDEYDDSFDAMTESESKSHRKAGNTGAKDFIVDEIEDDDDDDNADEEDQNDENYRDKSKDFCENPEAIRERWARNRNNKFVARPSNKPKPQGYVDFLQ